ncbi:potassium channel family protein [Baaleninema sp.]|uniref:potassium channel family protein n=1 Tax=Baaleninema sp. TaxID=3101197 RepID=UPI003CFC611D
MSADELPELDLFLVCGLGSLGQQCVLALKDFGVRVIGIELTPPSYWDVPNLPELLDDLIIGDCRQNRVFEQAQIHRCRAVLLVTSDEAINIETALAVRRLNPRTRLVVRSAKDTLNQLLQRQLGNFTALEPTQLPVTAFALAALSVKTLGFFNLDGTWLRVVRRKIEPSHPWGGRNLHELNSRTQRILAHSGDVTDAAEPFHCWHPETRICPSDVVVYVETTDRWTFRRPRNRKIDRNRLHSPWRRVYPEELKRLWVKIWSNPSDRAWRVAIVCGITVFALLGIGTVLFHRYYPETTWMSAFYATAILLLGGYSDLFGNFTPLPVEIPHWLQSFGLLLTLAGTAFVGVLYALLTQALLSARFQFTQQRPPLPKRDFIVIVGLGRVGQRVASLLQSFQQSIVGVAFNADLDRNILPQIPLLLGSPREVLPHVNFADAQSLLVLTDEEITNTEVALIAREANPQLRLAIRTQHQRLSEDLAELFPKAQIICAYSVAAEAFAGAAFGEKILSLLRLNDTTVLVTEYQVEAGDTLNGLLLAEVAYGYGVVPLLHQRFPGSSKLMPLDDVVLEIGDRLVVLATSEGLRRVEYGDRSRFSRNIWIRVTGVMTPDSAFEGANAISRIAGYRLKEARELFDRLPITLPKPLYQHQAWRLLRALYKARVDAHVVNQLNL